MYSNALRKLFMLPLRSSLLVLLHSLLFLSCTSAPPAEMPTETETISPIPPEVSSPPTTPSTTTTSRGQVLPITATATIASSGKTFGLEVTRTEQQRQLGLMFREHLPDNRGMLFEFEPARPVSFWMKNCLINLDIIFLHNGEVKSIARDVPPCEDDPCPTYGTPHNIDQVIEIRGGLADEISLTEGDKITVTFMGS